MTIRSVIQELRERTVDAIRSALESAGIQFIPENGGRWARCWIEEDLNKGLWADL